MKQQNKSNCTQYFKINNRPEYDPNLMSDGSVNASLMQEHIWLIKYQGNYDSNYYMKSFITQNLSLRQAYQSEVAHNIGLLKLRFLGE